MTILYIIQGLPASGKSTFAEQLLNTIHKGRVWVSSDKLRFSCLPQGMFHESEIADKGYQWLVNHCVWSTIHTATKNHLSNGIDVIVDATNLRRHFWTQYLEIAKEFKVTTVGVVMNSDVEDCIIRDAQRKRTVGESIIRQMHDGMDKFDDHKDDFNQIVTINYPKDIKSQDI